MARAKFQYSPLFVQTWGIFVFLLATAMMCTVEASLQQLDYSAVVINAPLLVRSPELEATD